MLRRWLTWAFCFVALALTLGALRYTSWVHFSRGTEVFSAQVRDVGGLREGTEIFMAGFQVGQVSAIEVVSQPSLRFDLELSVRKDIPIPEGTIAVMVSRGFSGSRVLELRPPTEENRAPLAPGSRIEARSEPELGDVILRADQAFRQLGEVASSLSDFTNAGIEQPGLKQAVARFEETLEKINRTLDSAEVLFDRVDSTAESLDSTFSRAVEEFTVSMDSVDRAATSLDAAVGEEQAALDSVLTQATARLEQLQVVLDGFDRESLGDLYSALDNLDAASRDLAVLMTAMKKRPLHTLRKGVEEGVEEGSGNEKKPE